MKHITCPRNTLETIWWFEILGGIGSALVCSGSHFTQYWNLRKSCGFSQAVQPEPFCSPSRGDHIKMHSDLQARFFFHTNNTTSRILAVEIEIMNWASSARQIFQSKRETEERRTEKLADFWPLDGIKHSMLCCYRKLMNNYGVI